jgi:hypothetical protein
MLRYKGLLVGAVVAAVGVTGGVVAASGDAPKPDGPLPGPPPTLADRTPVPSTREVVATAPDPHGKLPWGVEISRSETGGTCRAANAVHDGRLVVMSASGRPTPRKPAPQVNCKKFDSRDAGPFPHSDVAAVAQYGDVVFYGLVDEHVRTVTVVTPAGEEVPVTPEEHGAFIVAFAGDPKSVPSYDVRVTLDDGSVVTHFG